ncbi:MAG: GWxTD domain-containing protein [Candidatus Aminicenantes bacterium]|nr:GWxTD domain-containing protein [Candidatus Aminicenantes bacterium]
MKKTFLLPMALLLCICPLLCQNDNLSREHKDWLDTVSPIITKTEKEIFLMLKPEERTRFIQIFWKQRDPMPDTPENEFYAEYMKRVIFADSNFGRQSSRRGIQTERGYYYLLLGPPISRTIYDTVSQVIPLELWHYKGEVQFGLPPFFYLIFYQPQGIGEYRLYYPGEGPDKLVSPQYAKNALSREQAFNIIRGISAELANASLSYLPGEGHRNMATLSSSNMILSNVHSLAEKKFPDAYARTYLSYKDYVETEYSHNFFESNFLIKVFDNFNQSFIHWAIEPKKVNFGFYENRYYAVFQIILKLEDMLGNPVFEKTDDMTLRITPEQYKTHERQLFAIQDVLPIIPGNYKLFFLLQNKTAKDFTSFQTEIFIPEKNSGHYLSNLLLYHNQRELTQSRTNSFKAFSFGGSQFTVNTENNFNIQEDMGIYCQLYNFTVMAGTGGSTVLLEIFSVNSMSPVLSQRKPLEDIFDSKSGGINISPISLSPLDPGYYRAEVSILDDSGQKSLTGRENFIILARPYPVLPWAYTKQYRAFPESGQLMTLATQCFMTQKYEQAHSYLEQAMKLKDEPSTRLLLAKVLYASHRYQDSVNIVSPVYESVEQRESGKLLAANYAALKEWNTALTYLEKLLAKAKEISVLNLAAECYLNLNQPERALPLLRESLELNPAQPSIKDLEEQTQKQIKIKS